MISGDKKQKRYSMNNFSKEYNYNYVMQNNSIYWVYIFEEEEDKQNDNIRMLNNPFPSP